MIFIKNLMVRYPNQSRNAIFIEDVSIKTGERILVWGPSGCGKSTLALCMAGLIPHSIPCYVEGYVEVVGLEVAKTTLAAVTEKVGLLFQDPFTQQVTDIVETDVAFGLENRKHSPSDMRAKISTALQQVTLLHKIHASMATLSGGELQRTALAGLLAVQPSVVILDEPTSLLDPQGAKDIRSCLQTLHATTNQTIVIVDHVVDEWLPWVDRVLLLNRQGHVAFFGPSSILFQDHLSLLEELGVHMPKSVLWGQEAAKAGAPVSPIPWQLSQIKDILLKIPPTKIPEALPIYTNTSPAIEIRDLSYHVNSQAILSSVDLRIDTGAVCALVGANGAGKSTMLRHLVRDIDPPKQKIFLGREDIRNLSFTDIGKKVGLVFQHPEHHFTQDSVLKELELSLQAQPANKTDTNPTIQKVLHLLHLQEQTNQHPFLLSYGQKRRLSLAVVLLQNPDFLILDEPFQGQDQENLNAFELLIKEWKTPQKTVLITTHDMNWVASNANHVVVLFQGRVLYQGSPKPLFLQKELLLQAQLEQPAWVALGQALAINNLDWVTHQNQSDFLKTYAQWMQRKS